MDIITSNKNQRIKDLQKLNKDSSFRKKQGVFVVEGVRMFSELPIDRVKQVVLSESVWDKYKEKLCSQGFDADDERITVVKDYIYESISQTKTPQGFMAVVECMNYNMQDLLVPCDTTPPIYIVLESLQDPGNMGTIIRSSEAAGVTGIIIGGSSCDPYSPKVVRSTMGAIFRVPFVISENLAEDINVLKENGVVICGAHLDGTTLYDENLNKPVAFLIGNEGNGLSKEISKMADCLIRIPMEGQVESLNAGMSATLLAYEAYRQRLKG
ncbi:MAG: TrmH family RNA methyltransferase [Coprococcus sp.]